MNGGILKELIKEKKELIKECAKFFEHKYDLEEHYKDFNVNEDITLLYDLLIEKVTKKHNKKPPKDANAPKRPLSSFLHFSNSYREFVKKENPQAGIGEISKMLGSIWNELDSEDKLPYEQKAEEDKNKYKKALELYNKELN